MSGDDEMINSVFYRGFSTESVCGYCEEKNSSFSFGMRTPVLTVQAYQDMIDRGWRRSGKYCYKPTMETTCCPLYIIRCEALNFVLSKSQKKITNRVTRLLKSGTFDTNPVEIEQSNRNRLENYELQDGKNMDMTENSNVKLETAERVKKVKLGKGADPNLPRSKNKKLQRIEKKLAKDPNFMITNSVGEPKSLEDCIAENDSVATDGPSEFRVSLVRAGTTEFAQTVTAEASLYAKYQITIHRYQPHECDQDRFFKFLVDSPLQYEKSAHSDHPGYGSFHQQYWLGDKLIAVGVIDILPKCISSVYLFYDPDYHYLTLGTYSSLREIHLVRQLYNVSPDLKYYYMGFYLHSCPKLKYKAQFRPSFLLCPLSYTWHAMDKCIQKLDKEKYSIFNKSGDIQGDPLMIEKIPISINGRLMTYSEYKSMKNAKNYDKLITEYAKLVGPKLIKQLNYSVLYLT